ncbi:hypothetical protein EDD21DRAFT_29151 [Dissophora ornata]|nr:hypothetical protein EDD21DRAFT_29151 [Dissophora ornata]
MYPFFSPNVIDNTPSAPTEEPIVPDATVTAAFQTLMRAIHAAEDRTSHRAIESRRQDQTVRPRMGDYFNIARDYRHSSTRLQDPVHTPATACSSPTARPCAGKGRFGRPRQRSVRFNLEGIDRIGDKPRIHEPSILHPKEDGGVTSRPQPKAPEPVRGKANLQNGDSRFNLSADKQGRLPYLAGSQGCISSCADSPRLTEVSTIPVEGETVSVPSAPLRFFARSAGLHEGVATAPAVGSRARDQDISVPGRFDHCGRVQGTIDQGYEARAEETAGARIHHQVEQVTLGAISTAGSLGVHDQHPDHVLVSTGRQDQGHTTRRQQDGTQGRRHSSPAILIHRESFGNAERCFSCTASDKKLTAIEKQLASIRSSLERLGVVNSGGSGGPPMVADQPQVVERMHVDPPTNGTRRVHGRFGRWLGHRHRWSYMGRHLVFGGTISAHQPQGAAHSALCRTVTRLPRSNDQPGLRQHDDYSLRQPLRRNQILLLGEDGDTVMEPLSGNRDQDQNDIRPIVVQPRRLALPRPIDPTGVVDQSNILHQAGQNVGAAQNGSVRLRIEPSSATIHELEAMLVDNSGRRASSIVVRTRQRLLLPSVELASGSVPEDQAGTSQGNGHHSLLALSNLVPNSHEDGRRPTSTNPEGDGAPSPGKRVTHPRQESTLVVKRLANKRLRLASKGYSDEALSIAVGSNAEKTTLRSYAPAQQRYIAWALQRDIDPGTPSPTQLVNWLAGGVATSNWKATTVHTYKKAIVQL